MSDELNLVKQLAAETEMQISETAADEFWRLEARLLDARAKDADTELTDLRKAIIRILSR